MKTFALIIKILILQMLIAGCAVHDGEEKSIYIAVMEYMREAERIAIVQESTVFPEREKGSLRAIDRSARCFPDHQPSQKLVNNFFAANEQTRHISSVSQLQEIIGMPGEPAVRSVKDHKLIYPTLSLSSVGIEQDNAMVYINHNCTLCGIGIYLLLNKKSGKWVVVDGCWTWVS